MPSANKKLTYTLRAEYEGKGDMKQLSSDLKALQDIKVLQGAEESFRKTNAEFVTAKQKVRELRQEMQKPGGGAYAESFAKAKKEVKSTTTALQKQKEKLDSVRTALKGQGVDVTNLAGKYKNLQTAVNRQASEMAARQKLQIRSFKDIENEIDDLGRAYKTLKNSGSASMQELAVAKQKLRDKTQKLNAEMGKGHKIYNQSAISLGKVRSVVAPLVALMAGLSGAQFAKSIWDAGIASEQLNRSFGAIYEDSGKAGEELDWLRGIADELGFDFRTLAESYRGVAASSKGTILEGPKARKIFLSVTEASRALGLQNDQTAGSLNAVGQMMSKGKIQAEELRGQLGERLYGSFQMVAEAAGVSTEELNEMLERGEVGIDILSEFADVLHNEYGEAAKKASGDAVAAYGKMTTAWFDFKVALAENGFLDAASNGIKQITAALKDPQVQQAAINLMNHLINISTWMLRIGVGASGLVNGVKGWFETLFSAALRVASGIAKVTDAIGLTEGAAEELKKISANLWDDAKEDFGDAADGLGTMINGFEDTSAAAKKTGSVVDKTFDDAANAAKQSAEQQKQVTGEALEAMKSKYKEYADEVKRLQEDISGREKSLARELREMNRSDKPELFKLSDLKAEGEEYVAKAEELAKKAQEAVTAGDTSAATDLFKEAVQYADDAKQAFKQLGSEGGSKALKTAMDGVQESGELAIGILKQQEQAAKDAAEALNQESGGQLAEQLPEIASQFDTVNGKAQDLADKSKKFNKAWNSAWDDFLRDGDGSITKLENRLQVLTKDRTIKVHVEEVEEKATGGLVGVAHFATGGSVWQKFHRLTNPYITRGSGLRDDVPALLKRNEFVQPDTAVSRYGLRFMEAIRRSLFPVELARGFNLGGPVGLSLPPLPAMPQMLAGGGPVSGGGTGEVINMTMNFSGEMSRPSRQHARQLTDMVMTELQKRYRSGS